MSHQRSVRPGMLLLVLLLSAGNSPAQEMGGTAVPAVAASYDSRIADLEAELAGLRQHLYETPACEMESCAPCCEQDCSSGFYSGFAVVFAKPHFKESFQISTVDATANGFMGQRTLVPFSYDYSPTPRVWLGYVACSGFGVRADYWQYDDSADTRTVQSDGMSLFPGAYATTVIFPSAVIAGIDGMTGMPNGIPETLTARGSLKTEIINLEGTMHRDLGWISLTGAGGIRYASLQQSLASTVTTPGDVTTGVLNWTRRYEGIGPTISADAKLPAGFGGLSFIGGGGGALLFGSKNLDRIVMGDDTGTNPQPRLALKDADEVVGVFELRLGAECTHTFANGVGLSLQGTYEAQLWAEAGAPTLGFLGFQGFGIEMVLSL